MANKEGLTVDSLPIIKILRPSQAYPILTVLAIFLVFIASVVFSTLVNYYLKVLSTLQMQINTSLMFSSFFLH